MNEMRLPHIRLLTQAGKLASKGADVVLCNILGHPTLTCEIRREQTVHSRQKSSLQLTASIQRTNSLGGREMLNTSFPPGMRSTASLLAHLLNARAADKNTHTK